MTDILNKAKEILQTNDFTCVLFDGKNLLSSKMRGVKPLIEFLNTNTDFARYCAADKVVGAGAAHLYALLGIKHIWANVISNSAIKILESNNVNVCFDTQVPYIINRTGDGICPIEGCVKDIKSSSEAFALIKHKLKELSND